MLATKPQTVSKECSACRERKLKFEFYPNRRNGPDGLQARCKACLKAREKSPERKQYKREYAKAHVDELNAYHRDYYHEVKKHDPEFMAGMAERSRWHRRLRKYGMTRGEYEARVGQQEGKCAICGTYKGMELRVDHDHSTGAIRALLCAECNAGVGLFKEDVVAMRSAIGYLEKHGKS